MSGPDPSNTMSTAAEAVREQPNKATFEADLAALAARFAAESGGGLSAELSADLALEIVLNEIVEQACLATGATGAAIVLERDGEMVCRATSGLTAPELGSRFDTASGLSGECYKTRRTVWCDDAVADQRADAAASERSGLRSVVVMPLLRESQLVGVIELFSTRPYAFGIRDERTLEILADRALNNLEHAARPLELQTSDAAPEPALPDLEVQTQPEQDHGKTARPHDELLKEVAAAEQQAPSETEQKPGPLPELPDLLGAITHAEPAAHPVPRRDVVVWALAGSALACAILLGIAVGRRWGAEQAILQARRTVSASVAPKNAAPALAPANNPKPAVADAAETRPHAAPSKSSSQIPPGGLLVFEDGKEVFRMPPTRAKSGNAEHEPAIETATSVEPENLKAAPVSDGSRVLRRVEPEYPEAARQQGIEGTVVLDVHIAADGAVDSLQVVSGPALLADAASDAVKQWKFRPERVNGRRVEMQTRITLNFRLPK